jgi:hypothetical protein
MNAERGNDKKTLNEFNRGFSLSNFKMMRKFYLTYRTEIGQTPSDFLPQLEKGQKEVRA